jgi:hypothetical protein
LALLQMIFLAEFHIEPLTLIITYLSNKEQLLLKLILTSMHANQVVELRQQQWQQRLDLL